MKRLCLKSYYKRDVNNVIFISFIRPKLEYASVVWDNRNMYEKNKLENIQLEAGRIVTGTARSITLQSLYRETGWLTLADRRIYQKLVIMFIKLSILLYQTT